MSSLIVGNVNFESTVNNQIVYSANSLTIRAGGANTIGITNTVINAISIPIGSNVTVNNSGVYTGNATVNVAITPGVISFNGTPLNIGISNTQQFCSTGTWNKPSTGRMALIKVWGAGGSGGTYTSNTTVSRRGGGGGGGAYQEYLLPISLLNANETVTIGTGGAAATGNGANGSVGGTSSFTIAGNTQIYAYGGGGGSGIGINTANNSGGGGGGVSGAGGQGTQGNPSINPLSTTGNTYNVYGGGLGGYIANNVAGYSIFGGGGGGAGANAASTNNINGANSVYAGGGGGGGANVTSSGGSGGVSCYGGAGGNGANATAAATAGSIPGGGGGGAYISNNTTSGAGANGRIIVYVF